MATPGQTLSVNLTKKAVEIITKGVPAYNSAKQEMINRYKAYVENMTPEGQEPNYELVDNYANGIQLKSTMVKWLKNYVYEYSGITIPDSVAQKIVDNIENGLEPFTGITVNIVTSVREAQLKQKYGS